MMGKGNELELPKGREGARGNPRFPLLNAYTFFLWVATNRFGGVFITFIIMFVNFVINFVERRSVK
jgi:hypothetical protein